MGKIRIFASSVTLFLICLFYCVNNASAKTDGFFWEGMSARERQAYITGVIDGALTVAAEILVSTNDESVKAHSKTIAYHFDLKEQFTIPQVVEGLNRFYDDYANKKIAVDAAVIIMLKKWRGYPEGEFQKEIENLRKIYNSIGSQIPRQFD